MLTFLDNSGYVLVVKVSGKLTHADYRDFLPKLEAVVAEHGQAFLLLRLEDFHGWEFGAVWDDIRIGLTRGDDLGCCAVVGEKKWQRWITRLAKPFFKVKYFDNSELLAAWNWVTTQCEASLANV
jgi:universal stress protein A